MKARLIVVLALFVRACFAQSSQPGHTLSVEIRPTFNGQPLVFDTLTNRLAPGQTVSVTRLDFLLSGLVLTSDGVGSPPFQTNLLIKGGPWRSGEPTPEGNRVERTNFAAFIGGREGRTRFILSDLPAAHYTRMRFHVGLLPQLNDSDSAQYPPGHALNPQVNGLHWSWMGGYVFLAFEGKWLKPDGTEGGYSYHIAKAPNLMTVDLPVQFDLSSDCNLELSLDVARIFDGTNGIRLSDETISTHSRPGDHLAEQLRANIELAFSVVRISSGSEAFVRAGTERRIEIAATATPFVFTIPAYFPRPGLPLDNPLTLEGVELGRQLFFEPRLSANNSQSCATCHQPERGFSERALTSTGVDGRKGTRNAMTLFNLAWKSSLFWDGRAPSLRAQVLQPIENPIEMHESLERVVAKLQIAETIPDYPALFTKAFGARSITSGKIARALEQFLLTQIAQDSKFDRVVRGEAQFTSDEQRGFELFHTEYDPRHEQFGADCFHCHGGPLFQSQAFANNGLDLQLRDEGRFSVTHNVADRGKFAVPSLRNVEVTAPYMHDGRFNTLEEVVEHYSKGVKRNATLDPNLAKHPDGGVPLSAADRKALVAFLKTLTDERLRPTAAAGAAALASNRP